MIQNNIFFVYEVTLLFDELRETETFLKIEDTIQRRSTRQTARNFNPSFFSGSKIGVQVAQIRFFVAYKK